MYVRDPVAFIPPKNKNISEGVHMEKDIMQEVAFLFVEQYEKLVEPYKDSEVALIRATAEKGETAMYMVVASIFGPSLDQALLGAVHGGMDYITYYDETWDEMDEREKEDVEELMSFSLAQTSISLI